eukprot:5899119-Amphidinium_carterae.1
MQTDLYDTNTQPLEATYGNLPVALNHLTLTLSVASCARRWSQFLLSNPWFEIESGSQVEVSLFGFRPESPAQSQLVSPKCARQSKLCSV